MLELYTPVTLLSEQGVHDIVIYLPLYPACGVSVIIHSCPINGCCTQVALLWDLWREVVAGASQRQWRSGARIALIFGIFVTVKERQNIRANCQEGRADVALLAIFLLGE